MRKVQIYIIDVWKESRKTELQAVVKETSHETHIGFHVGEKVKEIFQGLSTYPGYCHDLNIKLSVLKNLIVKHFVVG